MDERQRQFLDDVMAAIRENGHEGEIRIEEEDFEIFDLIVTMDEDNYLSVNAMDRGQGARVVIGGLKFPFRDRGFARGYEDLADQTGAVLIPDIFKDIIGNRRLMSDPIHPNGNGYKIMAQRFLEAMPPR